MKINIIKIPRISNAMNSVKTSNRTMGQVWLAKNKKACLLCRDAQPFFVSGWFA